MAYKLANRAMMTVSNTPGTANPFTLSAAVTGFQTFAAAGVADADTVPYMAQEGASLWEIGIGTYTASGTSLARTTVVASSAGGTSKANFTSAVLVSISPMAADLTGGCGPLYIGYRNTNQSLTNNSGSAQLIAIDSTVSALGQASSLASNSFTPIISGYYQFNGRVDASSSAAMSQCLAIIRINGTGIARGTSDPVNGVSTVSGVYRLTTSDYVQLFAIVNANTATVTGGSAFTFLTAHMVRADV